MSHNVIDKSESNVRSYSRAFPAVFTRAQGSIMYDEKNKEYIDFFSGAGALNYGHNHPKLKRSMIEYIESDGVMHSLDMVTQAKVHFIETFVDHILTPRHLDYRLQFTGPTGANAVEAAIKLSRLITGRTNIVAFTHSFHGVSLGALATTSSEWFRRAAGVELSNVTFMPFENYANGPGSLAYFEQLLADPSSGLDEPAAVIVETIQGEGGVNVASSDWIRRLRKITEDRGIILIVDDVQAGCGRSGDFFSFEQSSIVPDMVVLSKSLSGSGLPMSLLLIKPDYDTWKPGQHNGTFRGNNLAFVSAASAIHEFWLNDKLTRSVEIKGAMIRDGLNQIVDAHPEPGLTVRGRGMFYGLDFGTHTKQAKMVAEYCFKNGLIIELAGAHDEVLKLLPALTIDRDDLQRGLAIISEGVGTLSN